MTLKKEYLTAKEAAEYLKVSVDQIYRYANQGYIGWKMGGWVWRFTLEELDAFAQGRTEHESGRD